MLPGSELNHRGLTSQTTHAPARERRKSVSVALFEISCSAGPARRRGQRGFGWVGLWCSEEIQEQGINPFLLERSRERKNDGETKKTVIRFMT